MQGGIGLRRGTDTEASGGLLAVTAASQGRGRSSPVRCVCVARPCSPSGTVASVSRTTDLSAVQSGPADRSKQALCSTSVTVIFGYSGHRTQSTAGVNRGQATRAKMGCITRPPGMPATCDGQAYARAPGPSHVSDGASHLKSWQRVTKPTCRGRRPASAWPPAA